MKKPFLIGSAVALSLMISASAATIVLTSVGAGTNNQATFTYTGGQMQLTGTDTQSFTVLGASGFSQGSEGGVQITGAGTISSLTLGTVLDGAVIGNLKSITTLDFANSVVAADTDQTSFSDYTDGGVAVTAGATISGVLAQINSDSGSLAVNGALGSITKTNSSGVAIRFGTAGPVVPEPSSALLLGLGGFALLFRRRK